MPSGKDRWAVTCWRTVTGALIYSATINLGSPQTRAKAVAAIIDGLGPEAVAAADVPLAAALSQRLMLAAAAAATEAAAAGEPKYEAVTEGEKFGLYLHIGEFSQKLSNFTATIGRVIRRVELGQAVLSYEIAATLADGSTAATIVPADRYARMEWPELLGPNYVVEAGRTARDHLRVAVQALTDHDATPKETIRTETGWAEVDGGMVYLHGRGAIGPGGTLPVKVELGSTLQNIALPDPPDDPAEIAAAVEAVLAIGDLVQAARPSSGALAAVMLALPWRAIIVGAFPAAVQLCGPKLTFKTESAMLVSRFFRGGVADDELGKARLIASEWTKVSAKALSRLLADAADTVLVVDELTGPVAVARATEVVQSLYNAGADVKLTQARQFAQTFTPRAALLTCGETTLDRSSARSRMLIVDMKPKTVDPAVLTRLQETGAEGRFAAATAAFIRWLAQPGRLDEVRGQFRAWATEHCDKVWAQAVADGRRPGAAVSELLAAFRCFGRFAVEAGGLDPAVVEGSRALVVGGLASLVEEQVATVSAESDEAGSESSRLIRTGSATGRYYRPAADASHSPPASARVVGWQQAGRDDDRPSGGPPWRTRPGAECIGWSGSIKTDGGGGSACAFFDPTALQSAVVALAKAAGEPFENPKMIARDLANQGISVFESRRRRGRSCGPKSSRALGGGTKLCVIAILRSRLSQLDPDEPAATVEPAEPAAQAGGG